MDRLKAATLCVQTLQQKGFIAYFAGGWVRDRIMGHPSDDIDIATSASTTQVSSLFPKTIPVGVAFGIIIVVVQGYSFEVATFRKDRGYIDGRRPTGVEPTTPEEDATRRDFTINGLFFDPIEERLYDFVGGKRDIEQKIIRAIGNPHDRFGEDRLRMMRAARYSTRFNFTIEHDTFKAIKTHAKELLPAVAMERIWQEFNKMSQFAHFDKGLILLHELGLLCIIFPQLKDLPTKEIKKRVTYIERFPKRSPPFAELLELFPGITFDQVLNLAQMLKLSNEEQAFVDFYYHAQSLFGMPSSWLDKLEPIEWAELYANSHSEIGLKMIATKVASPTPFYQAHLKRQKELEDPIFRIQTKKPYLTAKHLLKQGITPSPQMGKLLKEGMRIAVNKNITDPDEILKELKSSPLWTQDL